MASIPIDTEQLFHHSIKLEIEGLEAEMSFFKDLFAGKKAKLKTPEERKAASIQRLKKEGIPYIEHLPIIESDEQVRPPR